MFGAIAWGALGGTQPDHESTKSVPMQRGARFIFCRNVHMQRGARFSFFGDRLMVQHGLNEGVKNIYKTTVILHIFNLSARRERPTSGSRRTKIASKRFENKCLVRSPGELLEAPNWTMKARKTFPCSVALVPFFAGAFSCSVALVFLFLGDRSMVQHGLDEGVTNIYKTNVILHIFKVKGRPGATTKRIPKS